MAKKPKTTDDKPESFQAFINSLKSKYKDDGIVTVGNDESINVEVFPTNILTLDKALGCLGIPRGRLIELFGSESSGKTTTALAIIAACQEHYFKDKERKGRVLVIDAEHAIDVDWARKVGVNTEELLISQPEHAEQAFDLIYDVTKTGYVDLIVVDSVAAMIPKSQLEGEVGDQGMAELARAMSKGLNKVKGVADKTNTTILFINQIREKVGVMFGNNEVTPGGRALKFYSSIRMNILKGSPLKEGEKVVGFSPTVKIIKNKVARPFTTASYDITFGYDERPVNGVDKYSSLLSMAVMYKLIKVNGSFYTTTPLLGDEYGDIKLGAGKAKALETIMNSVGAEKSIYGRLLERCYEMMKSEMVSLPKSDNSVIATVDDEDEEDYEADDGFMAEIGE